jgi:hypothetical protein
VDVSELRLREQHVRRGLALRGRSGLDGHAQRTSKH